MDKNNDNVQDFSPIFMQFSVVGAPVRKIPNPPLQCYKTTNNIYACLITKQTLQF